MTHIFDVLVLALLHAICLAGAMTFVLSLAMLYERKWAPPRREDYLRAIEFAEYLAKAAEQYQACLKLVWVSGSGEPPELSVGDQDDLADCYGALNSAIYEFRKRAMRAVVPA